MYQRLLGKVKVDETHEDEIPEEDLDIIIKLHRFHKNKVIEYADRVKQCEKAKVYDINLDEFEDITSKNLEFHTKIYRKIVVFISHHQKEFERKNFLFDKSKLSYNPNGKPLEENQVL